MGLLDSQVDGCCAVRWLDHGRLAVAALPEHVDLYTADPIREQLLTLINRGAETLIADMTVTISCDHAGVGALARVYQRAAASGTELQLVVAAPVVRRVLDISHLDRSVSIYPVLEAALAARGQPVVRSLVPRAGPTGPDGPAAPDSAGPVNELPAGALRASRAAVVTPAVVWQALDSLPDGIALIDDADDIALVNRRLGEMFGYQHGELRGRPLRLLVPAGREARSADRDADRPHPLEPPCVSDGAWLAGVRKNGTAFPVQVCLAPVPARTGAFTVAVIRDGASAGPGVAARKHYLEERLDRITSSIFEAGLVLSTAAGTPPDELRKRIDEASRLLDDIVNGIYETMFFSRRPRPEGNGPSAVNGTDMP